MVRASEDRTAYDYLKDCPTISDEHLKLMEKRNPIFEVKEAIDEEIRVACAAIRRAWGIVAEWND